MQGDAQLRVGEADGEHVIDAGHALQVHLHASRRNAQGLIVGRSFQQQRGAGKTVVGGDLGHHWFVCLRRQVALGGGLHLAAQVGHMLVEFVFRDVAKADQDAGNTFTAGTGNETNIADARHRFLQWLGDLAFDIAGRGDRQGGDHRQPVEIDLRVLLARHAAIGQQPPHQHHQEGDVGEGVVAQQGAIEIHS